MRRRSRATSTPGITRPTARRTASRSSCSRKTSIITTDAQRHHMTTATIGAAKITRIEETYEHFFEAQDILRRLARRDRRRAHALDGAEPLRSGERLPQAQHPLVADRDRRPQDPDRHLRRQSQDRASIGRSGTSSTRPTSSASRRPASKPEEIDMVMCTHLHVDHVGWNTRLDNGRWVPTFPNAQLRLQQDRLRSFPRHRSRSEERPGDRRRVARQRAADRRGRALRRWSTAREAIEEHLSLDAGARPHARPCAHQACLAGPPGVLQRRHASITSSRSIIRPGTASRASISRAARRSRRMTAGKMRRIGRAADAAAFRRAAYLPHRREGRRLHAAVCVTGSAGDLTCSGRTPRPSSRAGIRRSSGKRAISRIGERHLQFAAAPAARG